MRPKNTETVHTNAYFPVDISGRQMDGSHQQAVFWCRYLKISITCEAVLLNAQLNPMSLNIPDKSTFPREHHSDFKFATQTWLTTVILATILLAIFLGRAEGEFNPEWFFVIALLGTAFVLVVSIPALYLFYLAIGFVNMKEWTILVKKAVLVMIVGGLATLTLIPFVIIADGAAFDPDVLVLPLVYTGTMIPVVLCYKLAPTKPLPEEV